MYSAVLSEDIRLIYDRFLTGDSFKGIAELLKEKGISTATRLMNE